MDRLKEYLINYSKNSNFHYINRYINFIKQIKNKGNRNLKYKEIHHIIPRCMNSKINDTIELTLREHYIAHLILYKCYFNCNVYYKLSHALLMMSGRCSAKVNSKIYEQLRINNIISFKNNALTKDCIKRRSETYKKKYRNGEIKSGVANKSPHNFRKICITDGKINKYIKEDNLCEYLNKGFHRGATQIRSDESKKQW